MSSPFESKIYYLNPYRRELSTYVSEVISEENGFWHKFEKTIFYPEGGGQSADKGWVNDNTVFDVQQKEGNVWHLLADKVSGNVNLSLDWKYRYENMRQHTGQHLLSAIFKNSFNIDTVSVHLGDQDTLIELSSTQISHDQLQKAEDVANEMIRQNIPINIQWISQNELKDYRIRRDIDNSLQPIRLVFIGDYDCTGCGGTHVKSTGEIGLIKIFKVEKIRKRIRIHSKIGEAAYRYFIHLVYKTQQISDLLSSNIDDIPERITALMNENKELTKSLKNAIEKWLELLAKQLSTSDVVGVFTLPDMNIEQLSRISLYWMERNEQPCFLSSEKEGKRPFVLRCLKNSEKGGRQFLSQYAQDFHLRGGGDQEFVQGVIEHEELGEHYFRSLRATLIDYFDNKG